MGALRFSSDSFPQAERLSVIQDLYAAVERVDIEAFGEDPVFAEASVLVLSALTVVEATCSPCISRRTSSHVADGKDDLVLCVVTDGALTFSARGGEAQTYRPGEAYLGFNDRPSEHRIASRTSWLEVCIPRAVLAPRLADLDRASKRKLRPAPALRLLTGYARSLGRETDRLQPEMACLSAGHVLDLVAAAVGPTRDAAERAGRRGVAAARLEAIKADIAVNLSRPDLSAETVAARNGISPQYLRALFNGEGSTFGDFVLKRRLAHARRLLADPRFSHIRISAIAYESGFGDLSYFNRTFRRRYLMKPSDARASAMEHGASIIQ